jgi:predicted Zn-dependent protease
MYLFFVYYALIYHEKGYKIGYFWVSHNNKCVISFSQGINDIARTCLPKNDPYCVIVHTQDTQQKVDIVIP